MKISPIDVRDLSDNDEFIDSNRFERIKSKKFKAASNRGICTSYEFPDDVKTHSNPYIEQLIANSAIDELITVIKSGKEASVFLGLCKNNYVAVKVYTDLRLRSFRRDEVYRQGRYIGSQRIEKAIDQGSNFGVDAHQIIWVQEEYQNLKVLHKSGVPVPRPVAVSGLAIVMEFVGSNEGEPAPRISDISMERNEAEDAFSQSVVILEQIYGLDRVHGDYSTFNLLWHSGMAVAIDFPQMINVDNNPNYKALLRRDIASLCKSFKRFGINPDEEGICRKFGVKYFQ